MVLRCVESVTALVVTSVGRGLKISVALSYGSHVNRHTRRTRGGLLLITNRARGAFNTGSRSSASGVVEVWVERERRRRTRERRADDEKVMEARATMLSSVDDYNFKGY